MSNKKSEVLCLAKRTCPNKQTPQFTSIVGLCYCIKFLLTCCIPQHESDIFIINSETRDEFISYVKKTSLVTLLCAYFYFSNLKLLKLYCWFSL